MKKCYLVVQLIERGFATDSKPYAVFEKKDLAEKWANRIYGYVEELDYYDANTNY